MNDSREGLQGQKSAREPLANCRLARSGWACLVVAGILPVLGLFVTIVQMAAGLRTVSDAATSPAAQELAQESSGALTPILGSLVIAVPIAACGIILLVVSRERRRPSPAPPQGGHPD